MYISFTYRRHFACYPFSRDSCHARLRNSHVLGLWADSRLDPPPRYRARAGARTLIPRALRADGTCAFTMLCSPQKHARAVVQPVEYGVGTHPAPSTGTRSTHVDHPIWFPRSPLHSVLPIVKTSVSPSLCWSTEVTLCVMHVGSLYATSPVLRGVSHGRPGSSGSI